MQQVKLALLWCILAISLQCTVGNEYKTERCACISGPPDYQCPSATLLQVYLEHEHYCTRYYKCVDGKAMEFQCPYGLYFDLSSKICQPDFTLCYRQPPCIQFADNCRCCRSVFDNTGLAPQNFYVCYNDGSALAVTCPVAYDPCTNSTIQLEFINYKCEVPPATTPVTTRK